jgi:hypothetical protein
MFSVLWYLHASCSALGIFEELWTASKVHETCSLARLWRWEMCMRHLGLHGWSFFEFQLYMRCAFSNKMQKTKKNITGTAVLRDVSSSEFNIDDDGECEYATQYLPIVLDRYSG